jgi:protein-disulfide isomerase
MIRSFLAGAALALGLCVGAPASAQTLTPAQKAEVQALVRDYIKQNPQVVQEALDELQRQRDVALRQRIENDARDYSIGPRNAPVTIVEFYDYRCPYCHSAMDWLFEAIRRNPQKVRVVFKEFPVLGPASAEASQAAIASIRQGRYQPFHRALMSFRGDLDSAQIDALARRSGIDVARMRRDMNQEAIFKHLSDNHEQAREARIEGTPAFMINGQWLRGWDKAEADRLLAEALRAKRR